MTTAQRGPSSLPARQVAVRIRNLRKTFDEQEALKQIDLDIYEGEFLSLLGPSGCGKTTLLRIIAGFEQPDQGEVSIGGVDTLPIPPHKRPVNTVFQSYALFPHMTVLDNVLFGLKMAKVPRQEALKRAERVMAMVEIESFTKRKPHQLSGGQKQRVALARAIVNEPKVLLLDEPLGALDLKLRKQLQVELMQLQRRVGITFIYVTHDQEEALVMSDRIAVMQTGLIDQLGSVEEVYERPKTRYVATFLGSSNLIDGVVRRYQDGVASIDTALGELRSSIGSYTPNSPVTLAVRPEKIYVKSDASAYYLENVLEGVVEDIIYTGVENQYLIRVKDRTFAAYVMNKALTEHEAFNIGNQVRLIIPAQSVVPLND